MKNLKNFILVFVIAALLTSCYSISHTVGNGGKGGDTVTKRQWYAVWGLAPLSKVDSKAMAGGAENYTITTKFTFADKVISIFTGLATISCQTVEVKK